MTKQAHRAAMRTLAEEQLAVLHEIRDRLPEQPTWSGLFGIDPSYDDPDPETVTVTLPARILGRPWTAAEVRNGASWAESAGSGEAADLLAAIADAMEADR